MLFPLPRCSKVTRWESDPYSLGAYSYVPPDSSEDPYNPMAIPVACHADADAALAQSKGDPEKAGRGLPLQTRVFFAGEATSLTDSYTVHGAYLSGEREAQRISAWWRAHHEELQNTYVVEGAAVRMRRDQEG